MSVFLFLSLVKLVSASTSTGSENGPQFMKDKGFWQEYHEAYPVSSVADRK